MPRLIDADTVVTIQVYDDMTEEWDKKKMTIAEAIDEWSDEGCPPTVDAVPTEFHDKCMQIEIEKRFELELKEKHVHWIGENGWVCSECGYRIANWKFSSEYLYCPNCGAKMDEVEDET